MKIGIVDSGLNQDLAEFAGRIDPASGDVAGGNRGISDEDGHGTAVTAVAAASRNDSGTMGVAFEATIVNLRADNPGSCGTTDGCAFYDTAIAAGIDAARTAGVKVINLSLGGSAPGIELLAAMQRAVNEGIVLVISAGNDGEEAANPDSFALVPAQQFSGNVIIAGSVGVPTIDGGVDINQLSLFSNRAGTGAEWYLAALGFQTRAPDQNGTEYLWSGTSFSAPTISGAVALMAQAFPNLSGQEIVEILLNSAFDLGAAGTDAIFGRGRLDIAQAFQPIGTTTVAGSSTTTSTTDNGTLPAASGDAETKGSMGAIILDGYSRAYVLDFAKTLRRAPQAQPLAPAVQASLRSFTAAAGPVSIAMTLRDRSDLPHGFALERLGIGPEDARKSRIIAGQALARLDSKTTMALGFGDSAKSIERRLKDAQGGAFMIARDVGSDPGFAASRDSSIAVRRNLGPVNVTVSGETGKLRRDVQDQVTEPGYRIAGVTVDRKLGSTWLSAGVSRLDERNSLLGGGFAPALGGGGSRTMFADFEASRELGSGFAARVSARRGWTSFAAGKLQTSAYAFDLSKQRLLGSNDRLGLRLSQPLRVESGGFGMMLPTAYDYSTESVTNSWRTYSLTPSGREIDAELSYGSSLLDGRGWLGANLFARRQPGHVQGADNDYGAAIRFTLGM